MTQPLSWKPIWTPTLWGWKVMQHHATRNKIILCKAGSKQESGRNIIFNIPSNTRGLHILWSRLPMQGMPWNILEHLLKVRRPFESFLVWRGAMVDARRCHQSQSQGTRPQVDGGQSGCNGWCQPPWQIHITMSSAYSNHGVQLVRYGGWTKTTANWNSKPVVIMSFWCLEVRGHKVNADLVNSHLEAWSVSGNHRALAAPGHHSRKSQYWTHVLWHPLGRVGEQDEFFKQGCPRSKKSTFPIISSGDIVISGADIRLKLPSFPFALVLLSYQGTRTRSL